MLFHGINYGEILADVEGDNLDSHASKNILSDRNNSYRHHSDDQDKLPIPAPRPTLTARWDIENGKLICRWIVGDRAHN